MVVLFIGIPRLTFVSSSFLGISRLFPLCSAFLWKGALVPWNLCMKLEVERDPGDGKS